LGKLQSFPILVRPELLTESRWPYGSTPKCLKSSGYERFKIHSQGTSEELDRLEASLASGHEIACFFCDETIGTFVGVDVLPYVDIVVTSLTKLFSGGSNVMGGR
jgi:cystathionine gamma-synthase